MAVTSVLVSASKERADNVLQCIYVTDPGWLAFLEAKGICSNVNFWRKDQRQLGLLPGDVIYFKPKRSSSIAGRGIFRHQLALPLVDAWERFGYGNGVASLQALRERTQGVLGSTGEMLNCLVLDKVDILPKDCRPPITGEIFPSSVRNCKFFEVDDLSFVSNAFAPLCTSALEQTQTELDEDLNKFDPAYISSAREVILRAICVRRGQSQFRRDLMMAYKGRCCVTGDETGEVLEAAHIHPFRGADTNCTSNGLLLRSDWHTLFDLGLWTIEKDFRIRLSPQLRSSGYSSFQGANLRLPVRMCDRPSTAALSFHRNKVFSKRG